MSRSRSVIDWDNASQTRFGKRRAVLYKCILGMPPQRLDKLSTQKAEYGRLILLCVFIYYCVALPFTLYIRWNA